MKVWFPTVRGGSGTDVFTTRLVAALAKRGVETRITWFPGYFEFLPQLAKTTRHPRGVTLIHANSWNAFAFAGRDARLVVTEHHCVLDPAFDPHKTSPQRLYHRGVIGRYEEESLQRADRITAVSRYTANSVKRVYGRDAQTIYNWVDTTEFAPTGTMTKSGSRFQLLFVGNLSKRKGADLLAPIMRKLGDRFELRFTSGLREAAKMDCPPNMTPIGRVTATELVRAYRECDALLFPTRFEGFGYAALEAMACGKPVIASDNSALPEVVLDRVTGLLCPTNDVDAFVTACRALADNRQLCREFGEAARYRAETVFSEDQIIGQYIEVYRELLQSPESGEKLKG